MENFDIEQYFKYLFNCEDKEKIIRRYRNVLEIAEQCYDEAIERFEDEND